MLDEKKIREERASVWSGMAGLIETARKEDRDLTVDERADYDRRASRLAELDKDLERVRQYDRLASAELDVADTRGVSVDEAKGRREREMRAFSQHLKRGDIKPYLEVRAAEYGAGLNESGFQSTGSAGGYLVPQGFWENLQIALKAYGGLLNAARIVRT